MNQDDRLDGIENFAHRVLLGELPPHEIANSVLELVQVLRDRVSTTPAPATVPDDLAMTLLMQLRCGKTDPRSDPNHPGSLLIGLGWNYEPGDMLGCEWVEPGRTDKVPISMALGLELRKALCAAAALKTE